MGRKQLNIEGFVRDEIFCDKLPSYPYLMPTAQS